MAAVYYSLKYTHAKSNSSLKEVKNGKLSHFIKYVKKLISSFKGWIFVLIFVVLIIAFIGNGLFPLIFQKTLPISLEFNTVLYA